MKRTVLVFLSIVTTLTFINPAFALNERDIKVEGKGYFYYRHDASKDDGQSNSFDFSRMYIGAKYNLSDEFTIRYLTDMGHQDKTGKFEVFAKYAYVDWKINSNLNLVLGLQGTHNWKQPENAWGYRSIQYAPMEYFGKYWGNWAKKYSEYLEDWAENPVTSSQDSLRLTRVRTNFSAASRSEMGSSADMGLSVKYKPSELSYVKLMILNGSGYKSTEDDMYKNYQFRTGVYLLEKAVHISGYFEIEPWRSIDETGSEKSYMNTQWDALVSYTQKSKFTLGVNVNSKTFAGIQEINGLNFSVFGNAYLLPEKLKALVRYDMYSTGFNDVDVQPGESDWKSDGSLFIIGFDYQAHEKVSIIPNIQILTYEDSDKNPVNTAYLHLYFKL